MRRFFDLVLLTFLVATGETSGNALRSQTAAESPPAPPRPGSPDKTLQDLLLDLGHESWSRRAIAQEKLFQAGSAAVPLLVGAARSQNLELAYRARLLLERIDPRVLDFQLLRVELGEAPAIVGIASGTVRSGDEVRVRAPTQGQKTFVLGGGGGDSRTYALSFDGTVEGNLDIRVRDASRGPSQELDLYKPLSTAPSVSLLLRSEECAYGRRGLELQRDRRRVLTLLRARERRQSAPPEARRLDDPAAAWPALVAELVAQADSRSLPERFAALDILADLRLTAAEPRLRAALAVPGLRPVACLGLGTADLLAEVLAPAGGAPAPSPPAGAGEKEVAVATPLLAEAGSLPARAAARLMELGDRRGLDFMLERLALADPSQLHAAMAALADGLASGRLTTSEQDEVVDAVLSADFLGKAVWQDMETEFLVTLALVRLQSAREGASRAAEAQEQLERLACGDLGPLPVPLSVCVNLWRAAQAALPPSPAPEAKLALRLLPLLSRKGVAAGARSWSARAIADAVLDGELPLDEVIRGLDAHVTGDDPRLADEAHQVLLGAMRQLPLRPGWLRPAFTALAAAHASAARRGVGAIDGAPAPTQIQGTSLVSLLNDTEIEIGRWTGLSRLPGSRPAPAADGTWREWTTDPRRLEAREEALRAEEKKAQEGQGETVFYIFDLFLGPAGTGPAPAPVEVLDGARLVLSGFEAARFRDRWGNPHQVTQRTPRQGTGNDLVQLQFDETTIPLNLGVPQFSNIPRKDLAPRWYETSELNLGSLYLPRVEAQSYRSLLLACRREAASPEAPPASGGVEVLWQWFIRQELLALTPDAPAKKADGTFEVLSTLRLEGALPLLRGLFEASPSARRARQLHELGEPRGIEYLRTELAKADDNARLEAARVLAELGFADGASTLVSLVQGNPGRLPAAMQPLDQYLAGAPPDAPARNTVLQFLVGLLDRPASAWRFQIGRILEREAGADFGFEGARQAEPAERQAAEKAAVEKARAWWAARAEGKDDGK